MSTYGLGPARAVSPVTCRGNALLDRPLEVSGFCKAATAVGATHVLSSRKNLVVPDTAPGSDASPAWCPAPSTKLGMVMSVDTPVLSVNVKGSAKSSTGSVG